MTEHWHPTKALLGRPGMPNVSRSITLHGPGRGFVSRDGHRGKEWLESSLPAETQDDFRRERAAAGDAGSPPSAAAAPVTRPRARTSRDEAVADARLWLVNAWQKRHASDGLIVVKSMEAFCTAYAAGEVDAPDYVRAAVSKVAWNTLHRWQKAHREGGWSGLVPRAGGHNRGSGIIDSDEDLRGFIVAQILERPGHVNCKHIMRALRARFDKGRLPAYRTLQAWVSEWLADNPRLVSAVADPDRHRSHYMPAGGDAAASIERLNQVWELDSTPADVLCTDGRHAIVGAIDIYSRRMKVLVVPTSKAVAIAALLRRCIMAWGVPEVARTDEGSDYTSRHLRRVLADLGAVHDALPPYSPDRKPFIERGLGSLSHGLLELLPGFAGHSVAEAQALRSRRSFAQRRGEGDADAFDVALTAEELQAACDAWLETVYEREPHGGLDGRSPFEVTTAWRHPVRRIENERALDLLLAEPADGGGWRTVAKKGLFVEGTTFIAAELGAMVGDRVQVRLDPADAGIVYVFDALGAFLCRAVAPEREGIDRAAIAAQMKAAWRSFGNEARAYARQLKRDYNPSAAVHDIIAAAREQTATVVPFRGRDIAHDSDGVAAAEAAAIAEVAAAPDTESSEERRARLRAHTAEIRAEEEARAAEEREIFLERRRRAREAVEEVESQGRQHA